MRENSNRTEFSGYVYMEQETLQMLVLGIDIALNFAHAIEKQRVLRREISRSITWNVPV